MVNCFQLNGFVPVKSHQHFAPADEGRGFPKPKRTNESEAGACTKPMASRGNPSQVKDGSGTERYGVPRLAVVRLL